MKKILFAMLILSLTISVFTACNEDSEENTKTSCNGNLDCLRNQYCDLDNPDTTGGVLTYYCTSRPLCQKEADCPIKWVCNISEGFCITDDEAEDLLCDSNDDCTKDATKTKCKLDTHLCVECLSNVDCTAAEPYCNTTTYECSVDGGDTAPDVDTGDTVPDADTGDTVPDADTGDTAPDADTGDTASDADTGDTAPDSDTSDTGTILVSEDFEDGGTNWSMDGVWEIGVPTSGPSAALSGTNVAATNLAGNYADNSSSMLVLNTQISLSSTGTHSITFMAWVDVEGNGYSPFDYMEVLVKKETDSGWPILTGILLSAETPSALDALDNTKTKVTKSLATAYYKFTGNLSAYAGKTVQIGFRFTSDASDNLSGIYIDDVNVK